MIARIDFCVCSVQRDADYDPANDATQARKKKKNLAKLQKPMETWIQEEIEYFESTQDNESRYQWNSEFMKIDEGKLYPYQRDAVRITCDRFDWYVPFCKKFPFAKIACQKPFCKKFSFGKKILFW